MSGSKLIVSMSASVAGFSTDRDGDFGWSPPSDELFGATTFGSRVIYERYGGARDASD